MDKVERFAALATVLWLGALTGCADNTPRRFESPTPRTPSGSSYATLSSLPDWGGVWENKSGVWFDAEPDGEPVNPPPYNPEWTAKYQAILARARAGKATNDPTANCIWPGMPRLMVQPLPLEILFTPGRVTTTHEIYSQVRHIYTDGRGHPDDLTPSFNGDSIGHWEGDTLVVDTMGLRADTMYQNTGMPHSDALHLVERWHLVGPDLLEIEITMIDPKAFTRPYVSRRHFQRHRDWTLMEYVCEENNRNPNVNGVTETILK